MPDEKVKAESDGDVIEVSTLLSIDSPMVIWRTDLEALGLGGGSTGGGSTGGGEVSGGGLTGGGEPSGGGEPPMPQVVQYIATGDAVFHGPEVEGALEDGRWFASLVQTFDEAHALAQQHLDGLAYVGVYVDGILVGPVSQH
jgi:hypothetical protein